MRRNRSRWLKIIVVFLLFWFFYSSFATIRVTGRSKHVSSVGCRDKYFNPPPLPMSSLVQTPRWWIAGFGLMIWPQVGMESLVSCAQQAAPVARASQGLQQLSALRANVAISCDIWLKGVLSVTAIWQTLASQRLWKLSMLSNDLCTKNRRAQETNQNKKVEALEESVLEPKPESEP